MKKVVKRVNCQSHGMDHTELSRRANLTQLLCQFIFLRVVQYKYLKRDINKLLYERKSTGSCGWLKMGEEVLGEPVEENLVKFNGKGGNLQRRNP